jgi:hypothetical protein
MADVDEAVVQRLDTLIATAHDLDFRADRRGTNGRAFYAELAGWQPRAMTAIASIVGTDHPYYAAFKEDAPSGIEASAGKGASILEALKADIEAGYLRRQEDLVAAAVFSDFLDMAGHLLEGGYYHAAASLTGAVVEDGLRRIATASGVAVGPKADINALSSKLRDKGIYSRLVAKRVTMWAEIRNNADHALWDQVTIEDVAEMYKGVTAFMAERLG